MADEEDYAGPNGSIDDGGGDEGGPESLAEFLSQDDGDGEAPDSSEEHEDSDEVETKVKAKRSPSDEDEGSDDDADDKKDARAESHSRMVRKLAQRERELTEHRAAVKDRDRRIAELEQRLAQQDPDDDLSLLRARAARKMGVQPNDPKVNEYLFDLSRDITLDHLGDAVEADPDLKRIRDERKSERQRREERRELESRIERMEREKAEAEARAQRAGAQQAVGQFLSKNAEAHPFLMAQNDVDPTETVTELAFEAIRTGQVEIRQGDDEAAGRLLATIAKNLDAHYRGLAETLSKKLRPTAKNADDGIDVPTERAGKAKKQTQTKRTGTTGTGGGGRGRPSGQAQADDDADDLRSFMKRELRNEGRRPR